jgi:hypothetical protein
MRVPRMDELELSKRGYWVFPTKNRQKYPTQFDGQKWDALIKTGAHELAHAYLTREDATGAALCPQSDDPVPLLILDLDTYGMEFDLVWSKLSPDAPLPDHACVVASPSGGFHLWFRLPPDIIASRLPATIDFGDGVSGEIRVSSKSCRLIMLPGSLVTNKQGKPAKYKVIAGELDPDKLAAPPETLSARLVARPNQGKQTEIGGKPTEAIHFIEMLEFITAIPEGGRNNLVAKVGQVLGRLHPGKSPDPDLVDAAWEQLGTKLGGFKQAEFRVAVNSGWTTGSRNGEKYQAREKNPTITDVKAECESVFGHTPWMVEVFDSAGKLKENLVGFGGSAKRRHEATRVATLTDVRHTLPAITRLASASMDAVSRSPLFIQPGWAKALEFMLQVEKGVDHLGVPTEDRFWELLDEWARIAAQDLLFLEAWTERRPSGAATPFLVWPLGDESPPALVLPPIIQEALLTRLGDIPKARSLKKHYLLEKTLVGMRSGSKVWVCTINQLPTTSQEYIGAQYELFVRGRIKQAEGQADSI